MSAFTMNQTGFAQLANELAAQWSNNRIEGLKHCIAYWLDDDGKLYNAPEIEVASAIKLKVDLLEMANYKAVNAHYDETNHAPVNHYSIRFGLPKWSKVQLLKNLQCLRYQMSEGDVPNSPTYKGLESLIGGIAENIANNLPEYNKANWGW